MKYKIRPATKDDIEFILSLTNFYVAKRLILKRTREEIKNLINSFLVAESEDSLVGVISFYDYGTSLKEIRSLAVSREASHSGIGSLLVNEIIKKINSLSKTKTKIFALTYSPDFFKKNGFIEVARESLPEKIWKDCQNCPNRDNCTETALVYSP